MSKYEKRLDFFRETGTPIFIKKTKKEKRMPAEVVERKEVTDNLMILKVRPERPFPFQPGQYVKLRVDGIKRRYSIVSALHEDTLEFFIERVPGGELTSRLWTLRCGETVTVRPKAKGKLALDPRFPHSFMVATVTGIGPFVSMLRSYLSGGNRKHKFYILHGASYQDEFGYRTELEEMAASCPDLVAYVPTISRPDDTRNATWTGETGRVNALVEKYLERFALDPASTVLYVCGHPGMVEDVQERFSSKGFRVKAEKYWKN